MALLEVDDLRVSFDTADGVVHAVRGVSFEVERGKTLGIVGESGSRQERRVRRRSPGSPAAPTSPGTAMLRRHRPAQAAISRRCGPIRGPEIGMIFQDPLSSLHPHYRVGWQIVEMIRAHDRTISKAAARRGRSSCSALVGIPHAKRPDRRLPAPVLRRHAAARDDRDGDGPEPGAADRRRADHGAGRHRAGAGARA